MSQREGGGEEKLGGWVPLFLSFSLFWLHKMLFVFVAASFSLLRCATRMKRPIIVFTFISSSQCPPPRHLDPAAGPARKARVPCEPARVARNRRDARHQSAAKLVRWRLLARIYFIDN